MAKTQFILEAREAQAVNAFLKVVGAQKKAAAAQKKMTHEAKRTNAAFSKLGGYGRKLMGITAGLAGGYAAIRGITASVSAFAAFEKQMASVSTMLDESSMKFMPEYTKKLREMSVEFGESTQTLSKGLYDILSASVAPAKALDVLTVSVKAAKAGMTDTAVAADAITTILNSYGMAAGEAGKVADILFAIVKRGKTTFAELGPSIGKVASLASVANVSLEELGAAIATLTRAGLQTDIALTGFKGIINAFLKPTEAARKAAAQFGLVLNTATLKSIGLTGVLQKLKWASAEQLAQIMPNVRGMAAFAAAVQQAEGQLKDLKGMLNSSGDMMDAFGKATDTAAFRMDQLKQKWEATKVKMGEALAPEAIKITEELMRSQGYMVTFTRIVAWELGLLTDSLDAASLAMNKYQEISARARKGIGLPALPPLSHDPDIYKAVAEDIHSGVYDLRKALIPPTMPDIKVISQDLTPPPILTKSMRDILNLTKLEPVKPGDIISPEVTKAIETAEKSIGKLDEAIKNFDLTAEQIQLNKLNELLEGFKTLEKEASARQLFFKKAADEELFLKGTLGKGSDELKVLGKKREGYTKLLGMIDKYIAKTKELRNLQIRQKATAKEAKGIEALKEQGQRVFEATRTPLEKYETEIGNLHKLLKEGAINWDTYGRAARMARDTLESHKDVSPFRDAGEFEEIRTKFVSVKGLSMGAVDPQLSELKEQTVLAKEQKDYLQQIANKDSLG